MTDHIDPALSLALVALDEQDPERKAALAHADGCAACRALLDQGAELLVRLEESEQPAVVSRELKARIEHAVWEAPHGVSFVWYVLLSMVALLSLALVFLDGDFSGPFAPKLGLHCLAYEAGFAFAPVPLAVLLWRGRGLRTQPVMLAFATASLALVGQLVLRIRCGEHDAGPHILVFHFGGVLLCALLGMVLGRYLHAKQAK